MSGRFNVAKAMHERGGSGRGAGGYDNPAMDMGSMPAGLNTNPDGTSPQGSQDSLAHAQSICALTMEALPRTEYYESENKKGAMKRPSIGGLHDDIRSRDTNLTVKEPIVEEEEHHGVKLGWIQGVLIPCLLNIWGVMLFLRLSWVVGQAGVWQSLVIIGVSAVVCVLTTLSMSAICTNGEVKGGGVYYIISRSLGPEFGASVGVIFAFANAVAASMNTIGFCDSLNQLLNEYGVKIVDGGVTDVRIVGTVAVLVMIIICAVGMEWEAKAQNFLVVIIIAAIVDFLVGSCIGPRDDTDRAKGFSGFDWEVLKQNWGPDYSYSENVDQTLFTVFAIFFPSVTGIQAGANISGDLKDPASSIPKGTLLALIISMISYAVFVFFAGAAAVRGATGSLADFNNHTYTDCVTHDCTYGLLNSYNVMQLMSSWGLLIYAGCFAATLSTALTNLLSVPRLIQALGRDRIYPGLIFFSKGYGKNGEPYRGYVLTFLLSAGFVLIAEINTIAPLISNFYLTSYALINFCTFHAALVRPLGWRPTFRYYNKWLSLAAFVMCIAIMFMISWVTSIITFVVFIVLYLIVIYRNPNVNWGSSTQAQTYKRALMIVHKLFNQSEHVKNYQPQVLLLVGQPQTRPPLIDLANLITRNNSLLMCAEICKQRLSYRQRIARQKQGQAWLNIRKVKGFFVVSDGYKMEVAARGLMQCSGVGRLRPNVLMMGYKSDWMTCSAEDLQTYFNILHDAFDNRLAVTILRLSEGLDLSKPSDLQAIPEELSASMGDLSTASASNGMVHNDSNLSFILHDSVLSQTSLTIPGSTPQERPSVQTAWENDPSEALRKKKKKLAAEILHQYEGGQEINKTKLESMMYFSKKQKKGVIDVWWMYDDGGLTILLPYILSTRSSWADCELRIFALANHSKDAKSEEKGMETLLTKFRIKYTSLKMIYNISDPPRKETIDFFENLISDFRESNKKAECVVTDAEYETLKEKTYRQLRLRELLQQNSKNSNLILMSLPMPRKGLVSAPLYMSWLEAITKDMPPFLLVRGNQVSVLTFYS